jgi:periplasmic protein TonB
MLEYGSAMNKTVGASGAAAVLAFCLMSCLVSARAEDGLVRVSEVEARKAAIKKVEPEYPAMARQVRLSGRVQVDVIIDAAGNVEKVKVLQGNVLLSNSAANALKRWKFTPFAGPGSKPVRVIASMSFDFHLQPGR